jgi:TonB family protein
MKTRLSLLLLFISTSLWAQTKMVERTNPQLNLKETFSVLKSDTKIKQGEYKATPLFSNAPFCKGYYKNNLKDSLWVYLGYGGNILASGYYKDDKRVGNWKTYNFDGSLNLEYDFTNNKLIQLAQTDSTKLYNVITPEGIKNVKLDRPPLFLNGGRALWTTITYPKAARENMVQGAVIISITIDENGVITNYRVKQSLGFGCDEEAMHAAKLSDGNWLPGVLEGKAVKVEYDMLFGFSLAN